jgi:DNA modification methylase
MNKIFNESCLNVPQRIAPKSINTIVTSPPYYGLRDYGVVGQIGLEQTPQEYVDKLVSVFRACHEVLRDDGTLWLNLGDSYCGTGDKGNYRYPKYKDGRNGQGVSVSKKIDGLKSKDLIGIPWRVAFALQSDGWYLRQDIIWHKPNPMPESVKDRCTKAHEYIFLLSKKPKYYFDSEAIKEPVLESSKKRAETGWKPTKLNISISGPQNETFEKMGSRWVKDKKNKRDVWTITTKSCKEAHFATFPPELIRPCILAGCPKGGLVLDPFLGAGTTAMVAKQEGRQYVGFELNPAYIEIAERRIASVPDELEFEIEPPKEDA